MVVAAGNVSAQEKHKGYFPDEVDPFMGDYVGRWSEEEKVDPAINAEVFPLGKDLYQIRIVAMLNRRASPKLITEAKAEGGRIAFEDGGYRGVIENGIFTGGKTKGKATFEMKHVVRESPTLGKESPAGAVVLFDGGNFDAWQNTEDWVVVDDILMVTPKGKVLETKQTFGDVDLHIEFRTPLMASSRGQGRGNCGVQLHGAYEIQVLDSYGLEGYYNECGALYKLSAPRVNACAPPLQWQTYDIKYTAPRYNDDGELKSLGRMTVYHNGILIQDDVELEWRTEWTEKERLKPPPSEPGRIKLLAHSNYVQFRNIWLVEK
jgi:hypothetical protein